MFTESQVKYAESLITAWLPIWKSKNDRSIDLLLFSGPKSSSKIYSNSLKHGQAEVRVHDYYTLGLDKTDPFEDQKLWEIADLETLKSDSTVIIDSLSSLLVYKGLSETCKFIERLSAKVSQVVCVYQRDFTPKKIPSVNTLGTTYVRIEPIRSLNMGYDLSYKTLTSHCKVGGGILQRIEIVQQNVTSYEIKAEKFNEKINQKSVVAKAPETPEKVRASFRIEMNDREMEQRNATPLPYTIPPVTLSESKIHYQPDEVDDLDEEDPDDDLDF